MSRPAARRRVRPAFASQNGRMLTTKGLPPDLLRDASRRLALAGLVYAIGFAVSLALNQLFLTIGIARPEGFAERTLVRLSYARWLLNLGRWQQSQPKLLSKFKKMLLIISMLLFSVSWEEMFHYHMHQH